MHSFYRLKVPLTRITISHGLLLNHISNRIVAQLCNINYMPVSFTLTICTNISGKIKWATLWQNQHNAFATSMDPDQATHPRSLIRIHTVRLQTLLQVEKLITNSMDPDVTARMRRLVWIHAYRKRIMLVGFVMARLKFRWRNTEIKAGKGHEKVIILVHV
jgi:hypothetical protein